MDIKKEYECWLENATADADVVAELKTLDDTKIEDAFYRDLAFGTGGLRGVIGAGTNRMNIYTVAKASQGLADYLKKNFTEPSVAIGYDSRIKSDVFAKVAAGVFAANGVQVNIWPVLMPVPTVSFATRYLHTSAGVMVTASHNPSKYNGYKVYGADGCQITTEAATEILAEIEKLDIFADVKTSDFETGVANSSIQYIPDEVYTAFVEQVNPFVAALLLREMKNTKAKLVVYWHLDIVRQKYLKLLFNPQNRSLLARADKVIATSPNYIEGSKWLQSVKDKCVVVPNCINVERMTITPDIEKRATEIREENKDKTICVAVGRHTEYKGFTYLVQASKLIDDRFRIYITGTGELTEKLHEEARGDNKITFTGRIDDTELKALILASDMFCFPSISKNEAFGLALAEGMYYRSFLNLKL